MCLDPISIGVTLSAMASSAAAVAAPLMSIQGAALGLSALGAITSYQGQANQAGAQERAINQAHDQELMDGQRQAQQQHDAAADQMNEHARKSREDAALFQVVAAESGGGTSVARAGVIGGQQADAGLATLADNAQKGLAENSFAAGASTSRAAGRISSISRPSLLGTMLTIGGAAATGHHNATKKP